MTSNAMQALSNVLLASEPAPDHAPSLDLFGRFVGSWDGTVVHHHDQGRRSTCEIHFGWALDGRAIQDVWIARPELPADSQGEEADPIWYGSTLRMHDPRIDRWRVVWMDPVTHLFVPMVGRPDGEDAIHLEGELMEGCLWRWRYYEIEDDSFRALLDQSLDEGATWMPLTEMEFQRRIS